MTRLLLISLLTSVTLSACLDLKREDPLVLQKIIDEGVTIRIAEFKGREWTKCLQQAEQRAVIQADSIIRARARMESIEPIPTPPKPDRPVKPPTKVLPDSTRVDSIING
jgi:hypothetical protein